MDERQIQGTAEQDRRNRGAVQGIMYSLVTSEGEFCLCNVKCFNAPLLKCRPLFLCAHDCVPV